MPVIYLYICGLVAISISILTVSCFFRKDPNVLEEYIHSALATDAVALMRMCTELGFKVGIVTFQVREYKTALNA